LSHKRSEEGGIIKELEKEGENRGNKRRKINREKEEFSSMEKVDESCNLQLLRLS